MLEITENFPTIKVNFGENITAEDFTKLTSNWLNWYLYKLKFNIEFDTFQLKSVNPKYCLYMAFFIKKIKKQNPQYLEYSKIKIYNKYIFKLAEIIFKIEKPVARVYLIFIENNIVTKTSIINP